MIELLNTVYKGSNGRLSVYDMTIPDNPRALIIFMHGYKGFKDWGCWNLVSNFFVGSGFGFVKFNVSHNGGTVENTVDFPDLEAFGKNTYSFELQDLRSVVDEVFSWLKRENTAELPVFLIGHSRGGGIAVLAGASDSRIAGVISWAGIADIGSRFPQGETLDKWKRDGVYFAKNARTNQQMPHFYSMHEDFLLNSESLNIESAAKRLTIPFLPVHGDADTSVNITEGELLASWTGTKLEVIHGADHTFGSSHPWENPALPDYLQQVCDRSLQFLRNLVR